MGLGFDTDAGTYVTYVTVTAARSERFDRDGVASNSRRDRTCAAPAAPHTSVSVGPLPGRWNAQRSGDRDSAA
ncbi:hypothetical protein C731_1283 [Mycolicibacterium hassiacum DSM 44199]|uniref:Uncharacterized protein n=1 Tax=Mycolicibacterium hassiacum (strain DSM 44199 / CIP 105218 / JCM 12690 / 3849) TaxID=1122247 RepID=K5B924_MYCHD|nr:hypothetical protein C731_1283 [Mycolicibacterium hassiacum DSM 44199]